MLLAASPHLDTYDAFSTAHTETTASPAPTDPLPPAQSNGEGLISDASTTARAPTQSIHTPQQLAQLEAIARAQTREKPESTLVSDDEKYLAAQLVYLASQHQASEYNRQKPVVQGSPNPGVYIPLSIQLPTHVLELRTRQKESSLRQAWFIAPPREESNYENEVDQILSYDELQVASGEQNGPASHTTPQDLAPPPNYERVSYLHPATVEVGLLQDALGTSVFPVSQSASTSKEQTTGLPPAAFTPFSTQPVARLLPSPLDPDVIETPPPLGETALPQFPSPVRSRTSSQSVLLRPANLPDTLLVPSPSNWPSVPDNPKGSSLITTTKFDSLLVPDDRPTLWPPPPVRPAPVHVAPPPSSQLQLALETAISKDTIVDPNRLPWAHAVMQNSFGMNPPVMQALRGFSGPPSPANGSPSLGMPPPMLIPPPPTPKTSESHPINISQVIPPEYIGAISSHLEPYPTVEDKSELETVMSRGSYFRIEPRFRLDRIIYALTLRAIEARAAMARYSPVPVRIKFAEGIPGVGPALFTGPGVHASTSEPNFDRPLKRPLAMTSPLNLPTGPSAKRMEPSPAEPPRMRDHFVSNMLNLDLQGNDVSLAETRHSAPSLSGGGDYPAATNGNSTNKPVIYELEQAHATPPTPIALPAPPLLSHTTSSPPPTLSQHTPMTPLRSLPNLHSPFPDTQTPIHSNSDFVLGNLYLSSCPGKKVRLNGPIKGRGAICRNLSVDLARVKSTGVHLVVCCLDDDEMEFLGAPWPEYKAAAATVGLDILRLPMPEGLCPLSVQAMSQHMDRIIYNYTLKGQHILVHCRGGVGRAGLVACTWMLKLGICGSVEPTFSGHYSIQEPGAQPHAEALMQDRKVARDSLELLERVVYIIRRQRSVKAIETYEQVRFLLEFIEYLRDTDAKISEAFS